MRQGSAAMTPRLHGSTNGCAMLKPYLQDHDAARGVGTSIIARGRSVLRSAIGVDLTPASAARLHDVARGQWVHLGNLLQEIQRPELTAIPDRSLPDQHEAGDQHELYVEVEEGLFPRDSWSSVEQILNKVAQFAHFIPRKWEVGQENDAGEPVFLSWATHRTDKEDDERSITWHVAPDGSVTAPNDRQMKLGWQAYALSLMWRSNRCAICIMSLRLRGLEVNDGFGPTALRMVAKAWPRCTLSDAAEPDLPG
jgi:hypothetical protein